MDTVQRGSIIAGVLSLLGALGAFAVVIVQRDVVSMFTAIGVLLTVNTVLRFRLAAGDETDEGR